ncbi:hypothetical protein CGRA01v4_08117 [Colletotrichum graminicola]|nr:hypothetical protein CGRA01v4_08117 [Colletotrichum graminicola]
MAADLVYIIFLPFAHTHRARENSGWLSFPSFCLWNLWVESKSVYIGIVCLR